MYSFLKLYYTWCKFASAILFTGFQGLKIISVTLATTVVKFFTGVCFVIVKEPGFILLTATD